MQPGLLLLYCTNTALFTNWRFVATVPLSKSISAIFPTTCAGLVSHLVISKYFNLFLYSSICYGDWWPAKFDVAIVALWSLRWWLCVLVAQSCLTLWDSMDCSPPGSSVHEILPARILEWVAVPFCRGFSWPRDWNWVSYTAGRFFTICAIREALRWWLVGFFFFFKAGKYF